MVLDVDAVHNGMNEIAAGIGENMVLAAHDLLAGVIASDTVALGGLDTLAIDHGGIRTSLRPVGL